MHDAMITQVRRFNRTVTQRVGALNDHYLARERSLGESRVLWEIGPDGRDVRSLRTTLELDSGYLSRLLRSLEDAGLVTVAPSAGDGRVRVARLTRAGADEWAQLDRGSDELAASLLAPLSERQRARMVAAMADVERLLTAALVEVKLVDPATPAARQCLHAYYEDLARRFDAGFAPAVTRAAREEQLRPPAGLFLVAFLRDEPVGCGA